MELAQLLEYWEQFKGWIIGLGTVGITTLGLNIGMKLRSNALIKKSLNLSQPLFEKITQLKTELVDLATNMVTSYKEIENIVKNNVQDIKQFKNEIANDIGALFELQTISIAVAPISASLKEKALETLKRVNLKLNSVALLEESIKQQKIQVETNLNDIINEIQDEA